MTKEGFLFIIKMHLLKYELIIIMHFVQRGVLTMKKIKLIAAISAVSAVFSSCKNTGDVSSSAASEIAKTTALNQTYEIVIEAEDGKMSGDVHSANGRQGYSGSGYATGFTQKSTNSWSYEVNIPESGHYDFTVRCGADEYKAFKITANGKDIGECSTKGDKKFNDVEIKSVYLEKGDCKVSLIEGWGWFDLDKITIKKGEGISSEIYKNVDSVPINPNANEKTKKIMKYLAENYGKKVLSGQYTNHGYSTETDAIYAATGKYPAIRGFDFIFYSPSIKMQGKDTNLAIEWSKKGGLCTFSWHWFAPMDKAEFYTEKTNFDFSKAVTDKDIALKSLDELKQMLDKGEITEECYYICRDIDAISEQLKILEKNNVTVLWRPLHEAGGGWFWWGSKGAENYKWLWRLLYERQTKYHKLNNLIWVYNGQKGDWYVGDDLCDIIGEDIYPDKHCYEAQGKRFLDAVGYSGKKIVALTENGVIPDIDLIERDNVYWSWFNTWCREFIVDGSGNISEEYTEKSMLQKVYNSDKVITLDELPDFD